MDQLGSASVGLPFLPHSHENQNPFASRFLPADKAGLFSTFTFGWDEPFCLVRIARASERWHFRLAGSHLTRRKRLSLGANYVCVCLLCTHTHTHTHFAFKFTWLGAIIKPQFDFNPTKPGASARATTLPFRIRNIQPNNLAKASPF